MNLFVIAGIILLIAYLVVPNLFLQIIAIAVVWPLFILIVIGVAACAIVLSPYIALIFVLNKIGDFFDKKLGISYAPDWRKWRAKKLF